MCSQRKTSIHQELRVTSLAKLCLQSRHCFLAFTGHRTWCLEPNLDEKLWLARIFLYNMYIWYIYIYTPYYITGDLAISRNITNLEPWLLTTTKLLSGMRIQVDCNDRKAPNFQWILSSTCSNSVDNRIRWCYDHNNKHAMTLQVKQIFTCDHIWLYCFT